MTATDHPCGAAHRVAPYYDHAAALPAQTRVAIEARELAATGSMRRTALIKQTSKALSGGCAPAVPASPLITLADFTPIVSAGDLD